MLQHMTLGSYQDRCVGGVMWRFHCLSWSSFCGFPMMYGWHVSVNENTSGLGNASALVGTCTSSPKRFWRGQHRMMKEGWISGADGSMKSGSVPCHVPSSTLKGSTPLRNNWLY